METVKTAPRYRALFVTWDESILDILEADTLEVLRAKIAKKWISIFNDGDLIRIVDKQDGF